MYHRQVMAKGCRTVVGMLVFAVLVPLSAAQFKVTDNFNRPDGAVGLGWSVWGNGAQISGNQLETFGELDIAGGIQRKLDVTFPLKFSFDFSTSSPSDGGFIVGFQRPSRR
jgi:glycyl-tRNA synthetase alpha subunit